MEQYLAIVRDVLDNGNPRINRTGERGFGEFGYHFYHDMQAHFPILSTKPVPINAVLAELVGFLQGADNAAHFRALGTKIWDANANANGLEGAPNAWKSSPFRQGHDDLGRIYGVQWNEWDSVKIVERTRDDNEYNALTALGYKVEIDLPLVTGRKTVMRKRINQLDALIQGIKLNPFGRRHIVTAWNPGELMEMALPPCHDFFQVNVRGDETGKPIEVDLFCHMRSVDVFLGMPFNIASYGVLLHMIGHITGLKPRGLSFFFGDTHIYESHLPEMLVQIRREPEDHSNTVNKPTLKIGVTEQVERDERDPRRALHSEMARADFTEYASRVWGESDADFGARAEEQGMPASPITKLSEFLPDNFALRGYHPQGPLKGKMAV